MPRYVDADFLDELITQLNNEGRDITRNEYKMLDSILFEFPTADVVERKKGSWKRRSERTEGSVVNMRFFACSVCGIACHTGYHFCPNCGAEMEVNDGEQSEV